MQSIRNKNRRTRKADN